MIADYEGDITRLLCGGADGEVPILATRNLILFPGVVSPILIGRSASISLVEHLKDKEDAIFAVFSQKNANIENPTKDDLYEYGVFAKIIRVLELPNSNNNITVIVQGLGRCNLISLKRTRPYLKGEVHLAPELIPDDGDTEFMTAIADLRNAGIDYIKQNEDIPDEAQFAIQNINNHLVMLNFICSSMPFAIEEKMKLLEESNLKERVIKVLRIMHRELQLEEIKQDIRSRTREDLDEQQREYFLQQQIRNIKEELGNGEGSPERKELVEKAEKKKWNEDIRTTFFKELDKLDMLNPQGPEYSVQLNYLQTLVNLPWGEFTSDDLNLKREYMAVLSLRGDLKSPIICLYGPPGVGKTSLGKSIAEAMKRKYVRISLGGMHDESEIRGHRRTYVGAMPGRIIKAIQKAGSSNPVFILDEIDKVTQNTINGDPSSALLEVLDPEQNSAFHDNYLALADVETIPFWQGIDTPDKVIVKPTYTNTSGVVTTAGNAKTQTGVFALLFDTDAAGWAMVHQNVYPARNGAGEYTNYWYNMRLRCFQDNTEKACVFLLA